jgi:serine/threonine protein phosphatase PrpC
MGIASKLLRRFRSKASQEDGSRPVDSQFADFDDEHALAAESPLEAPPAATFAWAEREPNSGEGEGIVIGERSTFGSRDWWSSGWWPATTSSGDIQADYGTLGTLAVAGVALRGNKHRLSGEPCEDAFHFRSVGSAAAQHLCVAVCDGVGSSARSRTGARWLAQTVTARLAEAVAHSELTDEMTEESTRTAVSRAVADVHAQAQKSEIAISDLQTTLTFAVIPASNDIDCRAIIGQVGDSPAFVGGVEAFHPVIVDHQPEDLLFSTATRDALTADPSTLMIAFQRLAPGDRLLLCTDGIGNYLWSSAGLLDLGRHLSSTIKQPTPPLELVRQLSFDLRSADDDRTMIAVWRQPLSEIPVPTVTS